MNRLIPVALCAFLPSCTALRDIENGASKVDRVATKAEEVLTKAQEGLSIVATQARAADRDGDGKWSTAELIAALGGLLTTAGGVYLASTKKADNAVAKVQAQTDEHYDQLAQIREAIALAKEPPK